MAILAEHVRAEEFPGEPPTLSEVRSNTNTFDVVIARRSTPYLVHVGKGHCWDLRDVAQVNDVDRGTVAKAADGGWGAVGDTSPVSGDELEADLDQGTTRKTIRKLDEGSVAAIREVTGANSDAEAVRNAVALARDVLIED